ncbi:MAG: putative S-layer protein [archaeon]
MKTKTISLFTLTILSLVILAGFASAATISEWALTSNGVASNVNTNLNAGAFTAGSGVTAISFDANGASAGSWTENTNILAEDYYQVTLAPKSGYDLAISQINFGERRTSSGITDYQVQWSKNADFSSATTIATVVVPDDDAEREGNITGLTINVSNGETVYIRWFGYDAESDAPATTWRINDGTLNVEGTVTVVTPTSSSIPEEITECSTLGMPSSATDIRIKKISLDNRGVEVSSNGNSVSFGSDESWFPFEDIQAEIEVKNYGDYDVDNVEVSWGVWDTDADEWLIEPDSEKDFNLDHGDTETLTVKFQINDNIDVDLSDITDGSHYKFYVYLSDGVVDDKDSSDDGEDFCAYDSKDAEIIIERDFVILYDVQMSSSVQCGTDIPVTAKVWNIGDKDQEGVYVLITNSELGISKRVNIGDVDSLDKEILDTIIEIPEDAEANPSYLLNFYVYNEDDDVYQTDFDDDDAIFKMPLKVEGCSLTPKAVVNAVLESGGKAGESLVIKATITNTGDELVTYTVNAAGYSSWASLTSINPTSVIVNKGESKEVILTFTVKDDVTGSQSFNIEVTSGTEVVATQPVSVTIREKTSGGLSSITGNFLGGGQSTYLWIIGILNVLLIVVIIIVAIRVAGK